VPDYANVLVKVVAVFGVINHVPATTPAHNVFCHSAVARILKLNAHGMRPVRFSGACV